MRYHILSDLNECSEFRQTITARPPRIVHGTFLLLTALLLIGLVWASWARVNLVVIAKGRIRPNQIPTHVYTPSGSEYVGRVIFAPFDEGDSVKKGDVLMRLDTSRIDNLLDKLRRSIEGNQLELINLTTQRELLQAQSQAAKDKSQGELQMAEESLGHANSKRESEIRSAQADQHAAEEQLRRVRILAQNKAVSQQEVEEAQAKLLGAREKLIRAQVPVDGAAAQVAKRSLELTNREFAVRMAELEARIVVKQSEKEALDRDLANLQMQRSDAELIAPFDGVIVSGRVRVGDMVEASKPMYELAQENSRCFEASVPAQEVGQLKTGLPVRIRFDAYDYQQYGTLQGTLAFISPDSKPIDAKPTDIEPTATNRNATFTIRVQLDSEPTNPESFRIPTKLGLTGSAEIVTDNQSLLNALLKHVRQTISLAM